MVAETVTSMFHADVITPEVMISWWNHKILVFVYQHKKIAPVTLRHVLNQMTRYRQVIFHLKTTVCSVYKFALTVLQFKKNQFMTISFRFCNRLLNFRNVVIYILSCCVCIVKIVNPVDVFPYCSTSIRTLHVFLPLVLKFKHSFVNTIFSENINLMV